MRLRIAFIVHRYNGIDLRTPPAGPWSCFIPNHRWFAPPANIQHPSGIGFCAANKIVTALLPRGKTDVSIIHVIRVTCRGSRVGCNPSMSSHATRLRQASARQARPPAGRTRPWRACHYSAAVQIKKMKKSLPFIHAPNKPSESRKEKRVDALPAF